MRVILIDDEENALDILEILLREIGSVTVTGRYTNPMQALDALEQLQPDAVFLDIQMPGMLGIEAARRIKAAAPHTQIVFTTAYSEYAVEAFELQSIDYLLKPFTKERLRNTISRFVKLQPNNSPTEAEPGAGTYVQCFGGFQIQTANGLLSWKTNKEKELCAFLIHHAGQQADAAVMINSIWPESELDKAKAYLYTCLSYLRKSFQANHVKLKVTKAGRGYAIDMEGTQSDVAEFLLLAEQTASEQAMSEKQYEKLNVLYKGEYLQGCDFHWAMWKGEELKNKYIQTLRTAYGHFLRNGNMALAADSLRHVLTASPDSEKDGRDLIRLYLHTDKRNEAMKIFRQLDHAVRVNLGVELEEETVRLYRSFA
ncbi:response regulator [Paenibacillus sp. OAS669]|uniref:response regulator n=1 Tax=Paenibacillus sp. OAS669 TaxID=2663821 RepID=UPI001A033AAA|nr:response regulator [Paenibacillus sp. OAS669]MBE1442380.1 two-component SAPR family response regulator [Paenibacillus sp. OAS669]